MKKRFGRQHRVYSLFVVVLVLLGNGIHRVWAQTDASQPPPIGGTVSDTGTDTTTPPDQTDGSASAMTESQPTEYAPSGNVAGSAPNDALNFQTDLFTGRFTYRVPIVVPPGRGGSQPDIVLGYNSSGGNGWCGVGWTLDLGYIQRQTRWGVPRAWSGASPLNQYDDSYGFEFSFHGVSSRLVPVGGGVYRAEVDNGAFLKFVYASGYWTVTDKSGNNYYFGENTSSRMYNSSWGTGGSASFRWGLSTVQDVNGNKTTLTYTFDGNMMYLSSIGYNASVKGPPSSATHIVSFVLETRPDPTLTFMPGYRVETKKRLKEIDITVSTANVRKYTIGYATSPSTFRSMLTQVTQYGSDYSTYLPPLTFSYQAQTQSFGGIVDWPTLGTTLVDSNATVTGEGSVRASSVETYVDLLDIDNDGLPDRYLREWTQEWDSEGHNWVYGNRHAMYRNTSTNISSTGIGWAPFAWDYSNHAMCSPHSQYTVMTDMNGDGLLDRVFLDRGANPVWYIQTNSAPGVYSSKFSWGAVTNELGADYSWSWIRQGYYNGTNIYVDLMDMNGDGLPDRVLRKLNSPFDRFKVQINNGAGFNSLVDWATLSSQGDTSTNWNSIAAISNAETFVGMFDMNGDGLPDRVMRKHDPSYTTFVVQYNNGAGFEAAENFGTLSSQGQTTSGWNSPIGGSTNGVTYSTLIDMNGDGLLDRVMRKLSPPFTNFVVQFNTGEGFTNTTVNWYGVTSEAGTSVTNWCSPAASSNGETIVDLLDINGDGIPDRVMRKLNSPYDRLKVQLGVSWAADLMSRVQNSVGGRIDVAYTISTKYDNRDRPWSGDPWAAGAQSCLPFPMWTVSQIIRYDGFGNTDTFTYDYAGGVYDFHRREFHGFNRVTATDPFGTATITHFHQGGGTNDVPNGEYNDPGSFSKQGIPYLIEVYGSDGSKYRQTLNKVDEAQLGGGWCFPFIAQTITMDYEPVSGNYKATAKQFFYDNSTGNLTNATDFGEVGSVSLSTHGFSDVGSDSVYTRIAYASLNNTAILNKPSSITITSDSAGTVKLRETLYSYDGATGNPVQQLSWISGSNYATNSIGYDTYGNPNSATDPAGISTAITYDNTYQQFPVTRITGGAFTNTAIFDARAGVLTGATDAKGLTVSNAFDVFFRPTEAWTATNLNAACVLWKSKVDYNLGGISGGVSYNYVHRRDYDAVDMTNGHETYTYSDGLGRATQTRVEAENGQYRVTDTLYDDRGNPNFVTLPYFSNGAAFTTFSNANYGVYTTYDPIGRANSTTSPANWIGTGQGDSGSPVGTSTIAYSDSTDPWTQVVTDAESKTRKFHHDAYGRSVQIDEPTGGGTTHYNYDKVGNLTNVTDHIGNATYMGYDGLGRKTWMTDPDMGTWSYSYDAAGRLVQQTDAKNQTLKFCYNDAIGRLTSKEIYNSVGTLIATVTYTYDSSLGDSNYTVFKGQLFRVVDREGWQKFSYDPRGRVLASTRYLSVASQSWTTTSTYDDADRVKTIVYPNKYTTVQYTYDTGGNMQKVESLCGTGNNEVFYFTQGFDTLGRVTGYTNGNGAATTYTYFTNSKRLSNVLTMKNTGTLQNLGYTYDKVANVKSIADNVYTLTASGSLSSINYDNLHRLTGFTRNSTSYSFTYGAIGNITRNDEFGAGTYSYSGSQPHAVTSANGKTYSYDSCGNMTNRNGWALYYNEENELAQVSGTNTVTFGYADDGTRLWKLAGGVRTIYIGDIFETKPGVIKLCHVFAGGKRIATFEPIAPACAWMYRDDWLGRGYQFAVAGLDWPFQGGRSPRTAALIPLVGILASSVLSRWLSIRHCRRVVFLSEAKNLMQYRIGLARVRRNARLSLQSYPMWTQSICVLLIVALFFVVIPTDVQAVTCSPVFWYYHSDHLGSSNVMTDRAGNLARHFEYGAFGTSRYADATCSFAPSNRYTDQVLDDETGLYYYNARYYDPELGQFVQPDSIVPSAGDPQSLNRYSYCSNNPLKYIDPSGHEDDLSKPTQHDFTGSHLGPDPFVQVIQFYQVGSKYPTALTSALGGQNQLAPQSGGDAATDQAIANANEFANKPYTFESNLGSVTSGSVGIGGTGSGDGPAIIFDPVEGSWGGHGFWFLSDNYGRWGQPSWFASGAFSSNATWMSSTVTIDRSIMGISIPWGEACNSTDGQNAGQFSLLISNSVPTNLFINLTLSATISNAFTNSGTLTSGANASFWYPGVTNVNIASNVGRYTTQMTVDVSFPLSIGPSGGATGAVFYPTITLHHGVSGSSTVSGTITVNGTSPGP